MTAGRQALNALCLFGRRLSTLCIRHRVTDRNPLARKMIDCYSLPPMAVHGCGRQFYGLPKTKSRRSFRWTASTRNSTNFSESRASNERGSASMPFAIPSELGPTRPEIRTPSTASWATPPPACGHLHGRNLPRSAPGSGGTRPPQGLPA